MCNFHKRLNKTVVSIFTFIKLMYLSGIDQNNNIPVILQHAIFTWIDSFKLCLKVNIF